MLNYRKISFSHRGIENVVIYNKKMKEDILKEV